MLVMICEAQLKGIEGKVLTGFTRYLAEFEAQGSFWELNLIEMVREQRGLDWISRVTVCRNWRMEIFLSIFSTWIPHHHTMGSLYWRKMYRV